MTRRGTIADAGCETRQVQILDIITLFRRNQAQEFTKMPVRGGVEFAFTEEEIEDMVVSYLESKKGEHIPRGEIEICFDVRWGHDCPHITISRKGMNYSQYLRSN